jgi:cysteine desulfurase family protein (TIGR01976 family)
MKFDLEAIRSQFPALSDTDDGVARIYLDNPAGTQVPRSVVDSMSRCMLGASANLGGYFRTSEQAGEIVADAQTAMADFLNAPSPEEIVFGQNMTSLTFHVSRSIGSSFSAGDEIILSRMDHDANVEPWVLMARDHDLRVRWLPFNTQTFEIDLSSLDEILTDRTRLVCIGGASNLTGTINDIDSICGKARDAGAWTFIDAVQSAPHIVTDVQAIGCDFLACSAYKFFGPHQGILWGRREVLERLEPYKVRPAPAEIPWSFAPGTASHEGLAGTAAAVDYLAGIGASTSAGPADRNAGLARGMQLMLDYEQQLSSHLVSGLEALPGVKVQGITAADRMHWRVPTVSFTHESVAPDTIAKALAERNIFVWSGHNYAVEAADALGILDTGGAVRVGPVHYNSIAELDTLLAELEAILA